MPVFNKERAKLYSFNEVYLEAPKKETKVAGDSPAKHKYVRLDSYDPYVGEIVSRKYTQLSEVSEETAIRYLKELEDKYSLVRSLLMFLRIRQGQMKKSLSLTETMFCVDR